MPNKFPELSLPPKYVASAIKCIKGYIFHRYRHVTRVIQHHVLSVGIFKDWEKSLMTHLNFTCIFNFVKKMKMQGWLNAPLITMRIWHWKTRRNTEKEMAEYPFNHYKNMTLKITLKKCYDAPLIIDQPAHLSLKWLNPYLDYYYDTNTWLQTVIK